MASSLSMPLFSKPWSRALLVFAVAAAALAVLASYCRLSPGITFLPQDKRAQWILFPTALNPRTHSILSMDALFRREFELPQQPRAARLHVRAAKRVELRINGAKIDTGAIGNWKTISRVEVQKILRAGPNIIEARVFNDNGPPLLWLALEADEVRLRTDETWVASFAGSSWRNVILASRARTPGLGNVIAGGEETFLAWAKVWPIWLVCAGLAAVICAIAIWWRKRTGEMSRGQITATLLFIAGLWLLLFWNNAGALREGVGFDVQPHLDYIKYVQERRALPLPTEGYEMCQPPLYYMVSAALLSLCRLSVNDESAVLVLYTFTMLCGIAQFVVVFLSLRLLFPRQLDPPLIGLGMAAFLPMQLYLSHYITNETLAATLASAAVYLTLRLLKMDNAPMSIYAWIGLLMGATILTKATGLLLAPAVVTALVFNLIKKKAPLAAGLRNVSATVAICFAVCGWQFIWIWSHFGTPILLNFDVASGFGWWQDPGYHVAGDYFRFGRSLISPLFSGFAGFLDGIYSTLWGDALCGGTSQVALRPPWNYNLVVAGYLLALVPTFLILLGTIAALRRLVRAPSAELILLLGFAATVVLGVIFMTLKVASYAQIKAFYGLSALVPFCFFVAIAWEISARRSKAVSFALALALLVWAANSFASYWTNDPARPHILAGLKLQRGKRTAESIAEARKAVEVDPTHPAARRFLALILDQAGQLDEALEETRREAQLTPLDSGVHARLGEMLAKQAHLEAALIEARRALELGPENVQAYDLLFACLRLLQRTPESIAVARDGLSIFPYNADLHFRLGLALAQETNLVTALNHFAYATLLRPDRPEPESKFRVALDLLTRTPDAPNQLAEAAATMPDSPIMLNELAWLMATHSDSTLRDGAEAVRLAERACVLTQRRDPKILDTLAAAYAESGNFAQAITSAREAHALGNADAVALAEKLLTFFEAGRPYHTDSEQR
jgi:Flp pilus assembly protein TadD